LEIVKKEISLNVGQPNNFEIICAMQGDNDSFEITATLYDVNKLYKITTDNIKLKGVNAMGQDIYIDAKSHTEHTVTFELNEQILAYDGIVKLVLVFTDSSTQLTTFPFVIKVVNSPGDNSNDDFKSVSALVEEAKKWALISKSYAVGTDNEVRKGDAKDNSKYYYEQIKELIDSGKIGNGKILYFETYEEFKKELDNGKIDNETLICIKEGNIDDSNTSDDESVVAGTLTGEYLIGITSDGVSYFSEDNGITWNILNDNGLSGFNICYSTNNNTTFYTTSLLSINKRAIFSSADAQVWKTVSTVEESDFYRYSAGIKYINNKLVMLGGYNYCFSSTDNGVTWKQLDIPIDRTIREKGSGSGINEYEIGNIEYSLKTKVYVACGRFGHSYYSDNEMENWNAIAGLDSDYNYNIVYFNNKFIMLGCLDTVYALTEHSNDFIILENDKVCQTLCC